MKKTSQILSFLRHLGNFIIPPVCPFCQNKITHPQIICDECFKKIKFIKAPICYRCGIPLPNNELNDNLLCANCLKKRPRFDKARAIYIYDSFSKKPILQLKYSDRTDLRKVFTHFMLTAGADLFNTTDIIAPVPLHWTRNIKRMYNQSDVIGYFLAKKVKKTYYNNLLKRIRYTASQEGKSPTARQKNVHKAFDINQKYNIKGKTILLIDDVFTTGATVNACASILKKNGAKAVYVLTIAHAIKH